MADNGNQTSTQTEDSDEHKKSLKRSWKSSGPVAKLTVVFAGIAALSTTIYAIVAGGQLLVMRGQLGEIVKQYPELQKSAQAAKDAATIADATLKSNQQQFRSEQRPLIWGAAGLEVNGNHMSNQSLAELGKQKTPLQINIQMVNGGRSPATELKNTNITFIFDKAIIAKKKVKEYRDSYLPSAGSVLMPNQVAFFHSTEPMTITDEVLLDMRKGRKLMFVLGKLEYRDIFSPAIQPYESQFCFSVNPDGMPISDCGKLGQEWIK